MISFVCSIIYSVIQTDYIIFSNKFFDVVPLSLHGVKSMHQAKIVSSLVSKRFAGLGWNFDDSVWKNITEEERELLCQRKI